LIGVKYGKTVKPPSDIIWSLRRRLERANKKDEHLAATEYHVEQYPENTARYVELADLYLARSEKENAVSILKKGLAINPGAEDIESKLTDLQREK
jgi:tetratricopeptide (TPR) repeat protein